MAITFALAVTALAVGILATSIGSIDDNWEIIQGLGILLTLLSILTLATCGLILLWQWALP